MKIELEVDDDRVINLLVGALEGGSDYWAEIKGFRNRKDKQESPYLPAYITTPMSDDGVLELYDNEDSKTLDLDRKKIIAGLQVMANKYPVHFGDVLKEDDDSTTADVFLQCCLFGEIRYG